MNQVDEEREDRNIDYVGQENMAQFIGRGKVSSQPNDLTEEDSSLIKQGATQQHNKKEYGNSIAVFDNPSFSIIIGPDYLCFLPTFIVFLLLSIFIIIFIQEHSNNLYFISITYLVCLSQPLSYLLVALSDPGIAHLSSDYNQSTFCRRCKFKVPMGCFHCTYCDRCIKGYDHHCPWTSKCIGGNNLTRFYVFLILTPVFMVYCAFAVGITVQQQNQRPNY